MPSWKGLLEIFIAKISRDEFAFAAYENKAREVIKSEGELYPKIAELIEKDFNDLWFKNEGEIRNLDQYYSDKVKQKSLSPFKAEIAMYIKNVSNIMSEYIEEIEKLKKLSIKSISGIITTNYDDFFENNFEGYKRYVGQDELIFSGIQGIGEIYKIHGTIEEPQSIVINSNDYRAFEGLRGFSSNEWYRDIVMNDKRFEVDDILEHVALKLEKENSSRLPINKYLSESNKKYEELEQIALKNDFESIICKSIKNNRRRVKYNSVNEIWTEFSNNWMQALDKIAYLEESKINVDELEKILVEIFKKDNDILESNNNSLKSNLRRVIRIYDYLKYGRK